MHFYLFKAGTDKRRYKKNSSVNTKTDSELSEDLSNFRLLIPLGD